MKTVLSKILFVTVVTILSLSAFNFVYADTTSTDNNLSTTTSAHLQIEVSTTTPFINSTINLNIIAENLENDPITWESSPSTTLFINNEELFDEDGIYELEITTTTPYTIYAKKDGFLNSELITITPVLSENDSNETNTDGNSSGNSSSNNQTETTNSIITNETLKQTAEKIIEYFRSQQDSEGKIIDGNITDWAIMSFGANGEYAEDISKDGGKSLLDYEKSYDLDSSTDMSACATYPRHILALLSAGIPKTDNAIIGLQEKMQGLCYTENTVTPNTYGIEGTNDDIFALLALLALDEDSNQEIITYLTANIIKTQDESNGGFSMGWGVTPDATGASINALKNAQKKGFEVTEEVFAQATSYLKQNQFTDGGWGYLDYVTSEPTTDILTTSWVMMGINSLEQTQEDWFNTAGKNPWNVLVNNLNEDGYYTSIWSPPAVDWFGMKHAVPALLGKSWPVVLDPIVEDFSQGSTFSYGGGGVITTDKEETPSSTEKIATSTLDIIELEETATPTPEIAILPVLLEAPVEEDAVTNVELISAPTPTPQTRITQTNVKDIRGEKIEEENSDEQIEKNEAEETTGEISTPEEIPEEPMSNTKKVALALGAGTLLYGLYLLFKLFA